MKSKFPYLTGAGLAAGLFLCAGLATAQTSNSIITFSVDMTGAANFVLGTDQVAVRGSFNGWNEYILTNNPSAANPYVFSGTTTDTADANGGQVFFKFWQSDPSAGNSGWENPVTDGSGNRKAVLPAQSGGQLVLPTMFYNDEGPATNATITFQVDMAQQINIGKFDPNADTVEVQGNAYGWSTGWTLTNNPSIIRTNQLGTVSVLTSNVYVNTFTAPAGESPGQVTWYKYVIQPAGAYEAPAPANVDNTGNRFTYMANETLPIVFFSDAPYAPLATNNVTFQVDMTAQVAGGAFNPASDTVYLAGAFNGWSENNPMTNNPEAANTNLYSTVVTYVDGVGATEPFKYRDPNYESLSASTPQVGGNRYFTMQPGITNITLAPVYFSDTPPGIQTTVTTPTEVTFTVNMTNAVEAGTQYGWDPDSDSVYLNGDFLGWQGWAVPTLMPYQLTNNPVGSSLYSLTLSIPAGNSLLLTYKYGMYNAANPNSYNDLDDEAGFAQNHSRYIRNEGSYTLPVDTFGNQFNEPVAFGQLAVGEPTTGSSPKVPISWLGLPGVQLQTSTNLNGNHWVSHPETDGATWTNGYISNNGFISVTNVPVSGKQLYFRLIRPVQQ